MANTHLAQPDLASAKFSCTNPDQEAESFVQLIERKMNFAPADLDNLTSYPFRVKALFSSLLQRPTWKWYKKSIENATTRAATRKQFLTRLLDGRDKFRHRMEVEHYVPGQGEKIRNFLHVKKKRFLTVDGRRTEDTEGVGGGDRAAERLAQGIQRQQRFCWNTLRGLTPI